jgi:plastocyanin
VARWTIRAFGLSALIAVACAGASGQPERTFRANEIQVIEPDGQPDRWTFGPSVLKVSRGTPVTIVNRGKEFHSLTADDATRSFDISVDAGKAVTFTFEKVGTFPYHCGVHPQMKATVEVCDGACG